jgi:hypothetical protein
MTTFRFLPTAYLALYGLLGALGTASCASTPTSDIHVHSAADRKTNFHGYRSFAWFAQAHMLNDRTGVWVPRDHDPQAEVKFLIDKKLRGLGLTEGKENPDLWVSLLIVADVNDVEEIKSSRGTQLESFDPVGSGALVVELIDAQTGKTIWMGGAEGELRGSRSVAESNDRLAYAVDKLLDQVPR